jgi:hypothetical protein
MVVMMGVLSGLMKMLLYCLTLKENQGEQEFLALLAGNCETLVL